MSSMSFRKHISCSIKPNGADDRKFGENNDGSIVGLSAGILVADLSRYSAIINMDYLEVKE
jgi:hypothetical protein